MKEALIATNLGKVFQGPEKVEILKGINLTVAKGSSIAITGPSGVGKTTLLHILATLEKPSFGELMIASKNTKNISLAQLRNQHIGFVFQNFHLLDEHTALENILMPAKIGRKSLRKNSHSYQHALDLLEHVGMMERKDFLAKKLSGGEKQRIAIARALCNDPDILFADEPTGNLDETHSQIIHDLMLGCCRKLGKTLIVVTHDHSLASLCDAIYLLENGKLKTSL